MSGRVQCGWTGRIVRACAMVALLFGGQLLVVVDQAQAFPYEWNVSFVNYLEPPTVGEMTIENRSNGNYRVTLPATPHTRWDMELSYFRTDPDFDNAVNVNAKALYHENFSPLKASGTGHVGVLEMSAEEDPVVGPVPGQVVTVDFEVQAVVPNAPTLKATKTYTAPAIDPHLEWSFDVNDDGATELIRSDQNYIDFTVLPQQANVIVRGTVFGAGADETFEGQLRPISVTVTENFVLSNEAPTMQHVQILSTDATTREVILSFSGVDADGDDVRFTVDWGDGTETPSIGPVATHRYAADGDYTLTVYPKDWTSTGASETRAVSFVEPPPNQEPVFEYAQVIHQDGFSVLVAASAVDADGDALTYEFRWGDQTAATVGPGVIQGHDYPDGDYKPYIIDIVVTDGRGGEGVIKVPVQFFEPPANTAPRINFVHEIERDGFEVTLAVDATDDENDPLTVEVDWNHDGEVSVGTSRIVRHTFPPGSYTNYETTITVTDPGGASTNTTATIAFPAPQDNQPPMIEGIETVEQVDFRAAIFVRASDSDNDALTYTVDWGDDTVTEESLNPMAVHTYANEFKTHTVRVTVTDANGDAVTAEHQITFVEPATNQAPTFAHAEVLDQDQFKVIIAASATDPDNDAVTYEINWGDGSAATETASGVAQHQYALNDYKTYTITVTARDGRGGVDTTGLPVTFSRPAPNQPPTIDLAEIATRDGFAVTLAMHAADPDGDEVSFRVNWGDGSDPISTTAGLLTHAFPDGVYRPYTIQVIAQDPDGLSDSRLIDVNFPAPAENLPPVFGHAEIVDRNGFAVVINAEAVDPDGDPLTYTIDWGDDREDADSPSATAAHLYPAGEYQRYTITIVAQDGRGGQAQAQIDHEFIAPPDNQAPTIQLAEMIDQDGFRVGFAVSGEDLDGDALTYTFNWGHESPETVTDGGVAFHDFPPGEFTAYTVLVTVRDGRGGQAVHHFHVNFPAPPDNQAPHFEIAQLVEKSDFDVVVAVAAVDPDGDPLTYTFAWGDESDATVQTSGVAQHRYLAGEYGRKTVTVTAKDGRAGTAVATIEIDFPAPPPNELPIIESLQEVSRDGFRVTLSASASDADSEPLTYRFSWDDETPDTVTSEGLAVHTFPQGEYEPYLVQLTVTDTQGGVTTDSLIVDFPEPEPNQDPVIEAIRLVKHDGWDVTCAVGAIDPDGDALSFEVNWGDGSDATNNLDGIAAHTYPAAIYTTYTVTVTVTDGRGGRAEDTATVDFPPPPANAVPIVDEVDVVTGPRGRVDITVHAYDPEGEALSYAIHWGDEVDESATENLPAGTGHHGYALPDGAAPYDGYVVVTDERGGATRAPFAVLIQDAPVNIRQLAVEHIHDGTVRIHVTAEDADGADGLVYDFDVDGDDRFDYETVAQDTIVHQYAQAGQYEVRVRVTDTWSGNVATAAKNLLVDEWVPANREPVISQLQVTHVSGGRVSLRVNGFDPDADQLEYRVHWGDEADNRTDEPMLAGAAEHHYAYPADGRPYAGWVDIRDTHGASTRQSFEISVVDTLTVIDAIDIRDLGDGQIGLNLFARDLDTPTGLLYSVDFDGDGVWEIDESPVPYGRHAFARPGTYDLRIRIIDPWSNEQVNRTVRHLVAPWVPENHAPIIDDVQMTVHARGRVIVRISARDPEGAPLGLSVHWGDENRPDALEPVVGDMIEHRYAYPVNGQTYTGFVRALDEMGAEVVHPFEVNIEDAPTELNGLSSERVREGSWLLTILADDPDGTSSLRYAFDFTADGTWDVQDLESPQLLHTYATPPPHLVRVSVTDLWSGQVVDGLFPIGDSRAGTPNLPPSLDDVRVTVGARGRVELAVEASDPESGELTVTVDWGDGGELETLTGEYARHEYAYPEMDMPYLGRVVVTDEAGLTAETSVSIAIQDAPTVIREVQTTLLGEGEVLVHVHAYDPDGADLNYQFDMDDDDIADAESIRRPEHRFQYEAAGEYRFNVIVEDSWSGQSMTQTHDVTVPPWTTRAPIAEDHLQTEEGRCVVLRVRQGQLTTRLDPDVCDRTTNPDESLWQWDFGDGRTAKGSEVGHRYVDEGVFVARVTGGTDVRPLASEVQVLVVNAPPSFIARPQVEALAGQTYEALLRLDDPGVDDELKVTVEEGPDGMMVTPINDREFQLTWAVPDDASGEFTVHLVAIDGHQKDDGFVEDGGRASLRFSIQVEPLVIPDAFIPPPDAAVPSFDEIQGDRLGCDATMPGPSGLPIVMLFICLAIPVVRRLRS
ncbi:MAG: PKD domain-containing protein [Myxococcota bacterium]|nr:PKD domain-containing protein [Myxococcota bacterium]